MIAAPRAPPRGATGPIGTGAVAPPLFVVALAGFSRAAAGTMAAVQTAPPVTVRETAALVH